MRFVVLGAGAVGGSVGALLYGAGFDVLLVARGPHGDAIREHGLRVHTPDETRVVPVPVTRCPQWRDDDVVLLAVKTQDVEPALLAMRPPGPVLCLSNGIAAERIATRYVRRVYGGYVFMPASHLTPGLVQLWASPVPGVIDVGAYPDGDNHQGDDDVALHMRDALRTAGFASEVRDDIMRYKRGKLLLNLGNAIEALCGALDDESPLAASARAEALACFAAAGLTHTIDATRFVEARGIGGATRPGGSTWQSLRRGKSLEVEFLNGEIVELGRAHGIPTPINSALLRVATEAAAKKIAPGSMSLEELDAAIRRPPG